MADRQPGEADEVQQEQRPRESRADRIHREGTEQWQLATETGNLGQSAGQTRSTPTAAHWVFLFRSIRAVS